DYDALAQGDTLTLPNARRQITAAVSGAPVVLTNSRTGQTIDTVLAISTRQAEMLLAGGLLNYTRELGDKERSL
ncbi:MAG: hypothetical protein RR022_02295, partial [Angelakisella sp.]